MMNQLAGHGQRLHGLSSETTTMRSHFSTFGIGNARFAALTGILSRITITIPILFAVGYADLVTLVRWASVSPSTKIVTRPRSWGSRSLTTERSGLRRKLLAGRDLEWRERLRSVTVTEGSRKGKVDETDLLLGVARMDARGLWCGSGTRSGACVVRCFAWSEWV